MKGYKANIYTTTLPKSIYYNQGYGLSTVWKYVGEEE